MVNELIKQLERSKGKLITFYKKKKIEQTFASLHPKVCKASQYLKKTGLKSGDTAAIIGINNLEWIIADLACIYNGIKLLPLEVDADFTYFQSSRLKLSAVLIADEYIDRINVDKLGAPYILLSQLMLNNTEDVPHFLPYRYKAKDVFSYKTTSGSTGLAKVLSHSVEAIDNSLKSVQELFHHTQEDRVLVFLPLNLLQQRYWLYSAILYNFTVIVVPKEYFFMALKEYKPTVIMGVPYIYEFIQQEFNKYLNKDVSLKVSHEEFVQKQLYSTTKFQAFNEFMGGEIRYLWTGSAPISIQTLEYFHYMGIPLYQGYGMNETCIIAKNYPGNNKIGSVGKLFPNIEVIFDENSQILVKAKYPVCTEYVIAKENDVFTKEGYVATGDIGYIDEDGYLYITGRIKEMIALSNSKKIFPQSIESKIELHPEIDSCVLYGDEKPYLVAIIVPSDELTDSDKINKIIQDYNSQSKDENRIYKYFISKEKFTQHNQLISNQNKIKRQRIYEKYKTYLDALYNN